MDKTAQDVLDDALRRMHTPTMRQSASAGQRRATLPASAFQLHMRHQGNHREVKVTIGAACGQGRIGIGVLAIAAWEAIKLLESIFQ